MKRTLALLVVIAVAGIFWSQQISSANNTPAKTVTFTKNVAPIFNAKCAECHRPGEGAPFSTLTYKDVRPWARSIREKVSLKTMPPWHADLHFGIGRQQGITRPIAAQPLARSNGSY